LFSSLSSLGRNWWRDRGAGAGAGAESTGSVFAAVAAAASQLQIFGNSTKTGGGAEEASEARTIGRMGSPFPIPSTEYTYPVVGISRVY